MQRIYYKCQCGGCIVTDKTWGWMRPDDPSAPPRAQCPECWADPETFVLTDDPRTNEVLVDRPEDLRLRMQAKDEEPEDWTLGVRNENQ